MVQNLISQQCHRKPSCSLGFYFCVQFWLSKPPPLRCQWLVLKTTKGERDFFLPERGFGSELVYIIPRQTWSQANQNERNSYYMCARTVRNCFSAWFIAKSLQGYGRALQPGAQIFKESLFALWLFLPHNKQLKFAGYTFWL